MSNLPVDPSMVMASKKDIMDCMALLQKLLATIEGKTIAEIRGEEEWMSTKDAMIRLKIDAHSTLHRWRVEGRIQARRKNGSGKRWEFNVRSCDKGINVA